MDEKLNINSRYGSVNQPFPLQNRKGKAVEPGRKTGATPEKFKQFLQKELARAGETGIKFSKHALKRLESRQVQLSARDLQRLGEAVDKVEAKGARESLLLMDNIAYIVSVKNRTVITAVDGESMRENVFTNIDSAVILGEEDRNIENQKKREFSRLNRPDLIRRPETAE